MPLKVMLILATEDGMPIPDTDTRMYHATCESCHKRSSLGSARHGGLFLCLDCLDEVLHPKSEEEG